MYDLILKQLYSRKNDLEVIVVGYGFMGFGFISAIRNISGIKVPLLITRRPAETKRDLLKKGFKVKIVNNASLIGNLARKGYLCISDNIELIKEYDCELVLEMTGDVYWGTDIALKTFSANKNLVTMNPELHATVGTELNLISQRKKLIFTDSYGDQPGSLSRLISQAKLMGFRVRVAGNMKRFMNIRATQQMMKPWANKYGLSPKQTTSFTDGTKQSIEMNLISNYFGMTIMKPGMLGPKVEVINDASKKFARQHIPDEGVVDYIIGMNLFPGVFLLTEHTDVNQHRYLRYLKMGNGPKYVLFEPYHLCHLEVLVTIIEAVSFGQVTINNGIKPQTKTVAISKFKLKKGTVLDGIGGDTVYGKIMFTEGSQNLLPIGFSQGAVLARDLSQDAPIALSDVQLVHNSATRLAGLF